MTRRGGSELRVRGLWRQPARSPADGGALSLSLVGVGRGGGTSCCGALVSVGEAPFLRGVGAKVHARFLMSPFLNARD